MKEKTKEGTLEREGERWKVSCEKGARNTPQQTPMTPSSRRLREKTHLSLLHLRKGCSPIPDFYGALWCFVPVRSYTGRERERKNRRRNRRFLSQPLFLDYLLLPFLVSLLYLFLSISLWHPCKAVLYANWFRPLLLLLPFLFLHIVFLWLSFESREMMKKKIRVSMEPLSSSTPFFPGGEEARARFKYHCLLQDYQELLKETKEKRERLEKILQKKLKLLAEVKFLRQKYQQFSTTKTVQFKLKKQSHRIPSTSASITQPQNPLFQTELPLKSRNHKMKQVPASTSTTMLDLNKSSEEMEGFETERKPETVDWFNRFSSGGVDALANDSMLSICRDSGICSNKAAKRKVSWQDQLALKV